jgi:hypothetical protein
VSNLGLETPWLTNEEGVYKVTPSAGKVLATVFWDLLGMLLVDFLEHGRTVNADRYCITLKLARSHQEKTSWPLVMV